MKDYSNYYTSYNDKTIGYLKIMFNKQLDSDEGEDVDIDNILNVRVIIQEHTNPLNEDKEDRKMLVSNDISVHAGSIVNFKESNEKWMIINNVSPLDDNGVYYKTKIYPCNTTLKWLCPIDRTTVHNTPAIQSNMSLYSIGVDNSKYLSTEDGKRLITVPFNDDTKELFIGQRFIIGLNVFSITEIYDGNIGVFEIKMQQTDKTPKDDFTSNIADNNISPTTTSTNGGFW